MSINRRVINISKTDLGLDAVQNISIYELIPVIQSSLAKLSSGPNSEANFFEDSIIKLVTINGKSIIGDSDIDIPTGYRVGDIIQSDRSLVTPTENYQSTGDELGVIIDSDGRYVEKNILKSVKLCASDTAVNIFTDGYSARDSLENGLDCLYRCILEAGKSGLNFLSLFPAFGSIGIRHSSDIHLASVLELSKVAKLSSTLSKINGCEIPDNLDNIASCNWNRKDDKLLGTSIASINTSFTITGLNSFVVINKL